MTGEPRSSSVEDYLKVIWTAGEWTGEPATTKAIADRLGISPSSVSQRVRRLVADGLARHESYGTVELTDEGAAVALQMVRRHRIIETFLVESLGYGWDEVHDEAEVLEHACSDRMIDALDAMLGHPTVDPHGDPIPKPGGIARTVDAVRGTDAAPGAWTVARVSDSDPEALRECARLGLVPGASIVILDPDPGGAVRCRIDGADASSIPPACASALWLVENR
ncbi:metal-dependent transcriptional regulator [Demequina zhanjiangensis]|uniref:Manganese transport regulator n=1 Tax=Demequina zhanjiangensis TaxID=3051659 RepID=A0ABT8FZY7_9MICO|nr:metal-dependent transcriptional regulator [Demequina sp. SYSU T00b26]MDN4472450.1 metal-dependent transcriptional regulator [Demequina sp. SYSU T00b26]